jgi:hypothetical protein
MIVVLEYVQEVSSCVENISATVSKSELPLISS